MKERSISILCLVDSCKKEDYDRIDEILWSALNFLDMPYEVVDLAKGNLTVEALKDHSVIIIGQEHLGTSFSLSNIDAVMEAVESGVGLVCFDSDLHHYKDSFKDALGLWTSEIGTHMAHLRTWMIRIWDNKHFITSAKDLEFIRFNKPVDVCNIVNIEKEFNLLITVANGSALPAMVTETYGEGRIVLYAISPKIWLNEYFGHGGGLDDIFWKSIVWAARKPFVMLAMPPFVTIRIDDCSGAPNRFEWVRTLNRHSFIPHVSLFTENIGEKEARAIGKLYEDEIAEFSFHAFTWTKQIFWEPKSPVDHSVGREFSKEELKEFFRRMDELSSKWGIKWSKVLTAHFGEVGKEVIPFLKERGIVYLGMPYAFGTPYGLALLKLPDEKLEKLRPYNGQGGVVDHHPDYPELFIVSPSYEVVPESVSQMLMAKGVISRDGQKYDFLWETGREKVDVELAAWYASFAIKFCLDSLLPAVLVTHEQNISVLNNEEWDRLLTYIDHLTSKYDKIFKGWSHIAEYAENLQNSKIKCAEYNPESDELECCLMGQSGIPLYLFVFKGNSENIERGFKEIPPYKGEVTIRFNPDDLLFKRM